MKLEQFCVSKLFGYLDIKVPLVNNNLIIVAENGAGKTTLLRLIYLFLSKQWSKLSEYEFVEISALIGNKNYTFRKSDYANSYVPSSVIEDAVLEFPLYEKFIRLELARYKVQSLLADDLLVNDLEAQHDVPIGMINSVLGRLTSVEFQSDKFDWEVNLLYLPTYRRIERNFEDLYTDIDKRLAQYLLQLFPQIQKQIQDEKNESNVEYSSTEIDITSIFEKLWRARDFERWNNDLAKSSAMELIEFGMDDVQFRFSEALGGKQKNQPMVEDYLRVCNRYLGDYKELFVTKSGKYFAIRNRQTQEELSFSILSSGEKQILSLFSYFLRPVSNTFVIIDEPELSLSLTWQEWLINDIQAFNVLGVIAATHSPFIITDTLKSITHGLNEFTN